MAVAVAVAEFAPLLLLLADDAAAAPPLLLVIMAEAVSIVSTTFLPSATDGVAVVTMAEE